MIAWAQIPVFPGAMNPDPSVRDRGHYSCSVYASYIQVDIYHLVAGLQVFIPRAVGKLCCESFDKCIFKRCGRIIKQILRRLHQKVPVVLSKSRQCRLKASRGHIVTGKQHIYRPFFPFIKAFYPSFRRIAQASLSDHSRRSKYTAEFPVTSEGHKCHLSVFRIHPFDELFMVTVYADQFYIFQFT